MNVFQVKLKSRMDELVHFVYKITKGFPKEELFSATSQLRRAALSIILNFIEGFARRRISVKINFFEISYGSLKETAYLLEFVYVEKWITREVYGRGMKLTDEIGAMLWSELKNLEQQKSITTAQ